MRVPSVYELPYGHPLRRDEAEDMEALREQLRGGVMSEVDRMSLIECTCDRCAQRAADCTTIEDAYICGDCRADIAAEEAEVEVLRQQFAGAVDRIAALEQQLRYAKQVCDDHGEEYGDNCEECRQMVADIDAALGGQ